MKFLLTISSIFLLPYISIGQLSSGFDPVEAHEMIALCNSYTYLELYNDDKAIIPKGYTKVYTSPVVGMDNKFQVYTKGKIGVLNFRGSTDKKSSWLENIYSEMIPVEGTITVNDEKFEYKFGIDTSSNIHSGYALGMAYLHENILNQIDKLNKQGVTNIILTGHSQGGALAILTRAYLEHSVKDKISSRNKFKVYTFAQPMSGNVEFMREYNALFCDAGMSYSLINPEDAVPNMPLSYNDSTYIKDRVNAIFRKDEKIEKKGTFRDGMINIFEGGLSKTVHKFGKAVSKQIQKELGEIILPEPTGDINYSQVGNLILLSPPEYPLEMKDSALLEDKEFMREHPRDENGFFENEAVYKKTSMRLSHKPYNYYTAVLRKYFPKKYETIEPKSFPAEKG